MITNNFHILTIKYVGCTNTKPSMVKIISERFGESKLINYNHSYNNTLDIAEAWLIQQGFEIVGHGEGKNHYYVITNTFKSPKAL